MEKESKSSEDLAKMEIDEGDPNKAQLVQLASALAEQLLAEVLAGFDSAELGNPEGRLVGEL